MKLKNLLIQHPLLIYLFESAYFILIAFILIFSSISIIMILMVIISPLVAGYILTLMLIEITKVMFSFIRRFSKFITLLSYLNYYRHQFTFRI